jgi:hypothetical protein
MKLIPIVFAVSLVAATAAAQPPDHRYRFDETGPTATDTGSGPETDGELGPGAVRVPGVIGSGAIQFAQYDLNGYVNIPPSVSAFGTGDFTVSFWVQKSPGPFFAELVGTRGGFGSWGNYVDFRGSDTGISVEISQDEGGTGYLPIGAPVSLADGNWHQITGVRSGSNAWLYYDGTLVGAGSSIDGATASLGAVFPFTVGVNDVVRTYPQLNCGCSFDDVRIYNRALSPYEILTPGNAIAELVGMIEGMGLPKGATNSLIVKLSAAQAAIARGNTGTAVNVLGAFDNEVSAQAGKVLTTDQAALLTAIAGAIAAHVTAS